jgi:hypothetical protein
MFTQPRARGRVLTKEHLMLRRILVLAVIGLLALPAAPAAAKSSFMARTSGKLADTFWTQVDGTPVGSSAFGNVHVGWLSAYETSQGRADVFTGIEDYDCEPGVLPGGGGGHGEEPEESGCAFIGFRFGDGQGLTFKMDRKLKAARLTGQLTIYGGGHGSEGVVGRPRADIIWTGVGDLATDRYTYTYRDGDTTYTSTSRSQFRRATMSGFMGPMGFDPDLSGGSLVNFKYSSRSRTK